MASIHHGDGGETRLASGQRVGKDDLRIACVGSVDELSSYLGVACATLDAHVRLIDIAYLVADVRRLQHDLYVLGAELARRDPPGQDGGAVALSMDQVEWLDQRIESIDGRLPQLKAFILPGGGLAAAQLHVARAVCRRTERQVVALAKLEPLGGHVVPYLNRLSLLLFSMARLAAHALGRGDELA
jgi:cob(I)alamin adenosyltransferase